MATEWYEDNFSTVYAAASGSVVASVALNSNHVHQFNRATGSEDWSVAGEAIYEAPVWPKDQIAGGLPALTRWANDQMWTRGLHAAGGHLIVQFSRYDPVARQGRFRYAILTSAGETVVATAFTTISIDFVDERHAYAVRTDDDGRSGLEVFRLTWPEVEVVSDGFAR